MRIFGCILMMAVLLLRPQQSSLAARQAIRVWGNEVLPALFPYMVLSRMAADCLFKAGAAMGILPVLGILSGSPCGALLLAISVKDKKVPNRQLLSLCALTGTLSPMFVCFTAASWVGFQNGWLLLFIHVSGALISAGLIWMMLSGRDEMHEPAAPALPDSCESPIAQSVSAIVNVGGCIVFFSVIASAVHLVFPFLPQAVRVFIHGFLEISGGLKSLSQLSIQPIVRILIGTWLAGFGGFSILSQNLVFLRPCGINLKQLILISLFRGCVCVLLLLPFLRMAIH